MKRSGDVTAAAIVLFFGCALLVFFTALGVLGATLAQTQLPPDAHAAQLFGLVFYFVLAAWGVATGVGVLQLRAWARISILVMSGVAIFFCICGAVGVALVPMFMRQSPGIPMPPATISIFIAVGITVLLIPVAIAIWWLVLFTRKRVIAEFAHRGAASLAVAAAPFGEIPFATVAQFPAASAAPLSAPSSPQIPLSIRIIAIFLIVSAGFMLADIPFVARSHVPNVILGILVYRWSAWSFFLCFGILNAGLAAAALLRKAWALDALIALSAFNVVNTLMFWVSPARGVYMDAVMRQETVRMQTLPPGMNLDAFSSMMRMIFPIAFGAGLVFAAVILYFLITRRRAFRAACAVRGNGVGEGL